MSRKLPLSLSLLSCVALSTAACEKGGTFDPLDNLPTGSTPSTQNPTTDLPKCADKDPTLPCKIDLSNLSFELSCAGISAMTGPTWQNPNNRTDQLQFGTDENTLVTAGSCGSAAKDCTAKLSQLPPAWNALPSGARVRMTFNQRYRLSDDFLLTTDAQPKIDGSKLMLGVPQFDARDLATFTGSRKDGANPELHATSLWFTTTPMRTLSFTLRSRCYRVVEATAYWYIEKMTAEALPALP